MATSEAVKGTRKSVQRRVVLTGTSPIMFDRYAGDNETKLAPEQKVNLDTDGRTLVMPALNIMSFLSAENTPSAPKVLLDARKYKTTARACLNYATIAPDLIPILRDGEKIEVGQFVNDKDPKSGMWIHRCVARLEKGIPNPKQRPVLPLPWSIEFELSLIPNDVLQETQLSWLFSEGGKAIGLGTFRGVFGKFAVAHWE